MASTQPSYRPEWAEPRPDFRCAANGEGLGFTRVTLCGELDLATAPQLADVLAQVPDGSATVILDLSELTFMDSSGLHVILAAQARLARAGGRLALVCVGSQVHRLFELTGADRHVELIRASEAGDPASVPSG